ncbi:hypothetical protein [Nonomuraea sp. B19D2]|uniref:hypothetical protein n=1 Tax=Nonomuraea sp. B19D2 TaxID=3159561 RepID=UPI0032DB0B0B
MNAGHQRLPAWAAERQAVSLTAISVALVTAATYLLLVLSRTLWPSKASPATTSCPSNASSSAGTPKGECRTRHDAGQPAGVIFPSVMAEGATR